MKKRDDDMGPCCICEREIVGTRNILMLPKRSPYLLGGWGCVQCGLPSGGATAIVCDACITEFKQHDLLKAVKFFCKPDGDGNYVRGRARIAELESQPVWRHDMSKHTGEDTQ